MNTAAVQPLAELGGRLERLARQPDPSAAAEMLALGEQVLEHARGVGGLDDRCQAASVGTYVYRLTTDERVLNRSMVLVK